MKKNLVLWTAFVVMFFLVKVPSAIARGGGGGGHSIAGFVEFISPSQDDMDLLIDRSNTRASGISTKPFGQGYEFAFMYQYRISGTIFAIGFRPSLITQSSSGTSVGGQNYKYSLSGWTVFPMLKLIPLENDFIKFFMQIGIGYGRLSGSIQEDTAKIDFVGGNFGGLTGLGAEFCFSDSHCVVLEGNFRYLPFERNKATKVSGTFASGSLTNAVDGQEVEIDNRDLATSLSGVMANLGYIFTF
jgi:opacity protein-like surface antigen